MIVIDVTGRVPIFEQICRGICGDIAKGVLKPHDRIPAARVLARELGINPNTVAKAYTELERDGIIYSRVGKGSFIAEHGNKADRRFTDEFEQKARDALQAGVPMETLEEILKRVAAETPDNEGVTDND
ncbi:MAG: GntR family transcriptional regulator [Lachnospiraceae bacterium]|nr:GntR family transcriptional regulator [Lachnospiraceae bacterium]